MQYRSSCLFSIVLFVLVSFPLISSVGASSAMWNQTYGGTDLDGGTSVVETSDGGYAIAGVTGSFGAGVRDFWLVKTDASGNMEWNQTYGRTNDEEAFSLVATSDGGFALAGYKNSFLAGADDFWLVKTDASGNVEWNQTYGGTSGDFGFSVVKTSDGGFALAGWTYSYGAGGADVWLVKTDEYGIIPEFPSWIILTVGLLTLTVSSIIYKRGLKQWRKK